MHKILSWFHYIRFCLRSTLPLYIYSGLLFIFPKSTFLFQKPSLLFINPFVSLQKSYQYDFALSRPSDFQRLSFFSFSKRLKLSCLKIVQNAFQEKIFTYSQLRFQVYYTGGTCGDFRHRVRPSWRPLWSNTTQVFIFT